MCISKMKIRSLFVLIGTVALLVLFAPQISYEHQDGCHRWHSCPSDSGSYVCGDLGYDDYCPDKELRDSDDPKGLALLTSENISVLFDADDGTLEEGWVSKNGKQYIFDEKLVKKFVLSKDMEQGRILGKTVDGDTFYISWNLDKLDKLLVKIWTDNSVFKVIESLLESNLFKLVEPENIEEEIVPKSEVEHTGSGSSQQKASTEKVSNEDVCLAIVAKLFANLDPTTEELAELEAELKENNCGD